MSNIVFNQKKKYLKHSHINHMLLHSLKNNKKTFIQTVLHLEAQLAPSGLASDQGGLVRGEREVRVQGLGRAAAWPYPVIREWQRSTLPTQAPFHWQWFTKRTWHN